MNNLLISTLDTIYQSDQGLRKQIAILEEKHGAGSEEMKKHWNCIHKQDSENLKIVQNILDTRGWLGQDKIGTKGNLTLFLVIQHSPIEIQQRYLPMMRDAVMNNNAQASELVLLEDRVALRTNKRQIYGSQILKSVETGEYYVAPLEDPKNVDERRALLGLESLQEYVSNWNITWNIEKHKELNAMLADLKKELVTIIK